ncbi:60S ribosomal protein l28 [Plakobranchus ocellatus]|uniref:60S ribosomal protein l28 n=1 Tax=Plakobranchus ocellatus TaxID=259542 RepID=A0AAV3XTX7_9GAST|nr:60S ribosomal protein l28 [Plakobranchus ocellatus]
MIIGAKKRSEAVCKESLRRPAKNLTRQELKKDSRRTIATIRATLRSNNYRKDLVNPAVRRACAILKSQKPVVIKSKARGAKKQ